MKLYITAMTKLSSVADKERGATMPEYALMVALIAVVALTAVTTVGTNVTTQFTNIATALN